MRPLKNFELWLLLLIILLTVFFVIGRILNWYSFGFFVGPLRLSHWLVLVGSLYVAFATPAFAISKRRFPKRYDALAGFHTIGNLSAFLLVSIHFTSQVTRPAASYPELGEGLALYIVMLLLVASGFLYRFQIIPRLKPSINRFVHVSVALSFYIIIGIHILHGLGIL